MPEAVIEDVQSAFVVYRGHAQWSPRPSDEEKSETEARQNETRFDTFCGSRPRRRHSRRGAHPRARV